MTDKKITAEQFEVAADNLLTQVRELVHEGNVRLISLKREDGSTLLEIPLSAGLAVPVLTAVLNVSERNSTLPSTNHQVAIRRPSSKGEKCTSQQAPAVRS